MDCILRTPQIRLHEKANYITSATGSSFRPQTLCQSKPTRILDETGIVRIKERSIPLS